MLAAVFVFTGISNAVYEHGVTMGADRPSGGRVMEAWSTLSSPSGALYFDFLY